MTDTNLNEAENIATGDIGPGLLGGYRQEFADSLLFLGTRGDSLWEKNHANVNNRQDFTVGNTLQQCSHSYVETCLDVNAVCVHIPMLGVDSWSDLSLISRSGDLEQYSTGNDYDRPIARRILQDRGIDGAMFGQKKNGMGVSYHFYNYSRILRRMSPAAGTSLSRFKNEFRYNKLKMLAQRFKFYSAELPAYMNYMAGKLHLPLKFKKKEQYISSPQSILLLHWSIDIIKKRYLNA